MTRVRAAELRLSAVVQICQRQAAKAREIADRLEDADYIRVGTVKAANRTLIPEA